MNAIEVKSLQNLTREVEALFKGSRDRCWFRGHSSRGWDLLPTVRRGYSKIQEKHLANDFYVSGSNAISSLPDNDDYAGWLALMRLASLQWHDVLLDRLMDRDTEIE